MNYKVEFHRPEILKNPFPSYEGLIKTLYGEIGKEALESRIEAISYEWALNSGYYFKVIGDRHLFIHISLNEKDFI